MTRSSRTVSPNPFVEWSVTPAERLDSTVLMQETMGSSLWMLEMRETGFKQNFIHELNGLASLSGGTNIFFEAEFQIAGFGRVTPLQTKQLVLNEKLGEETSTRLYLPLGVESIGIPRTKVLRVASNPFAPISLPLIEESDAEEIVLRFASLFARIPDIQSLPILFEDFPLSERPAALLLDAFGENGFTILPGVSRRRPALAAAPAGTDPANARFNPNFGAKRRKELARQLRKLKELNEVEFEVAESFWDVLVRFEEFLVLETRSWKGRNGTSIHIIRKTAAFARQAIAALARQNRVFIYSLRMEGRAIASLIVLRSGNRYYPWKIAYDPLYQSYSPGVQLLAQTSGELLARPRFAFADSLAAPGSPLERMWPDHVELNDVVIAAGQHAQRNATRLRNAIDREKRLKNLLKSILRR